MTVDLTGVVVVVGMVAVQVVLSERRRASRARWIAERAVQDARLARIALEARTPVDPLERLAALPTVVPPHERSCP